MRGMAVRYVEFISSSIQPSNREPTFQTGTLDTDCFRSFTLPPPTSDLNMDPRLDVLSSSATVGEAGRSFSLSLKSFEIETLDFLCSPLACFRRVFGVPGRELDALVVLLASRDAEEFMGEEVTGEEVMTEEASVGCSGDSTGFTTSVVPFTPLCDSDGPIYIVLGKSLATGVLS